MRNELRHAIAVLRLLERAVINGEKVDRIAEIVEGLRHAGALNHSALLVGIAEALEDWLIELSRE